MPQKYHEEKSKPATGNRQAQLFGVVRAKTTGVGNNRSRRRGQRDSLPGGCQHSLQRRLSLAGLMESCAGYKSVQRAEADAVARNCRFAEDQRR